MAAAHHSSSRASLLNGLRTGGVRSASTAVPHSAAPAGTFNIPRFPSSAIQQPIFPEEEEFDQVSDLFAQSLYVNANNNNNASHPMTAALDGTNRLIQQQMTSQRALNPHSVPFSPAFQQPIQQQVSSQEAQLHAYQQMQLMQLEIIRLQNAQAQRSQQVQAAVLAEALRQQARRGSAGVVPASAGPLNTTFDMRSITPPARRPSQAEILKTQLGINNMSQSDDQVPMTAALGGRFGARLPSNAIAFPSLPDAVPRSSSPPKQSTMAGAGQFQSGSPPKDSAPSKSDAAASWRRGNTNTSVPNGMRTVSTASPSVKITPPAGERSSPSPSTPTTRLRPRPLSFFSLASSNVPAVAVIDSGSDHEDALSSDSSTSQSNPATPQSLTSLDAAPLSPREEATKKLYEGLGMGRPAPQIVQAPGMSLPPRVFNQPVRQPRGPPSGADELGPKNFATRLRRKAIGGLGVLMDARERRESIEVY